MWYFITVQAGYLARKHLPIEHIDVAKATCQNILLSGGSKGTTHQSRFFHFPTVFDEKLTKLPKNRLAHPYGVSSSFGKSCIAELEVEFPRGVLVSDHEGQVDQPSSGSREPRGPCPPPGPVKISHKKDGHRRRPHRFHVSCPPPYPTAGSATAAVVYMLTCRKWPIIGIWR